MFTHKDIALRTIFVINCTQHDRVLRVSTGELLIEEHTKEKTKTLTKIPFPKTLALFVIGHITMTSPLLERCKRYGVALVVMKPNLRPVCYWSDAAEANFLLRKKQYQHEPDNLDIARVLVQNKIQNQQHLLMRSRRKDEAVMQTMEHCRQALENCPNISELKTLLGCEGQVAKEFFAVYFETLEWKGRKPRIKSDPINVILDIGYTILFNYIESNLRLFGFDLYVGVYHRLWFKRKSLVCDIMEPFRCIIDHAVLLAFHRKQFQTSHFEKRKHEYYLKPNFSMTYYQVFFEALIERKREIFQYVQQYYRAFMGRKTAAQFPTFQFS